jgi:alpha-amylase
MRWLAFLSLVLPFCTAYPSQSRGTFVQLFEWKWSDIATECENYLGPYGYSAVQVSPPQDHIILSSVANNPGYPWWQRYQPVSYIVNSRSGTDAQFQDMVKRCSKVGVQVYVDLVINHMTGNTQKSTNTGVSSSAGSSFDATTRSFPTAGYTSADFHSCPSGTTASNDGSIGYNCVSNNCNIDWGNENRQGVQYCQLSGLTDLKSEAANVISKIQAYINKLISYGVMGFRIDAAKHIPTVHLQTIINGLNSLPTSNYNPSGSGVVTKPYITQEVDGDSSVPASWYEGMYTDGRGTITELNSGRVLSNAFWYNGNGYNGISSLYGYGLTTGMVPSQYGVSFVDNHDTNRCSIDNCGSGENNGILSYPLQNYGSCAPYCNSRSWETAQAFSIAHPYGYPMITSSYSFGAGQSSNGPPSDASGNTNSLSCTSATSCNFLVEHRLGTVLPMVEFRNTAWGKQNSGSSTMMDYWWVYNYGQSGQNLNMAGFSRTGSSTVSFGAIVINNDHPSAETLNSNVVVGMPAGRYCDIITGYLNTAGTGCTSRGTSTGGAKLVTVVLNTVSGANQNYANFIINPSNGEPRTMAIHLGSDSHILTNPVPPTLKVGLLRTRIVLAYGTTSPVYVYGGIDYSARHGCSTSLVLANNPCAIDYTPTVGGSSTRLSWANGYTTSHVNANGQQYNILDVTMNCAQSEKGWLEVKYAVGSTWENNIANSATDKVIYANGNSGYDYTIVPRKGSTNHWIACGYNNIISWQTTGSTITTDYSRNL